MKSKTKCKSDPQDVTSKFERSSHDLVSQNLGELIMNKNWKTKLGLAEAFAELMIVSRMSRLDFGFQLHNCFNTPNLAAASVTKASVLIRCIQPSDGDNEMFYDISQTVFAFPFSRLK